MLHSCSDIKLQTTRSIPMLFICLELFVQISLKHCIEVPDGFLKACTSFPVSNPSNEDVQLIVSKKQYRGHCQLTKTLSLTLVSLRILNSFQRYIKSAKPFEKNISMLDSLPSFLFFLSCSTHFRASPLSFLSLRNF